MQRDPSHVRAYSPMKNSANFHRAVFCVEARNQLVLGFRKSRMEYGLVSAKAAMTKNHEMR